MSMKKLALLLLCLASVLGCERISDAEKEFLEKYGNLPTRPVSFKIDGVRYYSEMDNESNLIAYHFPAKLKIEEREEGFAFKYVRYNFEGKGIKPDFYCLNLKMASPEGDFTINKRYDLSDESLTGRPYIHFKDTQPGSQPGDLKTYRAQSGWIEFTECDLEAMTLGGRFEFTVVYKKGELTETLNVTEGTFSNIPYENVESEN